MKNRNDNIRDSQSVGIDFDLENHSVMNLSNCNLKRNDNGSDSSI